MRPHRIGTWALSLLVAVGLVGMPGGAWGQSVVGQAVEVVGDTPSDPRTFGTASEVAHVIFAWDLGVRQGTSATAAGPFRSCLGGACSFTGGVRLPAGALVSRIELEGCDGDATQEIQFNLNRAGPPVGGAFPTITNLTGPTLGTTGIAATPQCGFFSQNLVTPETIDNESNTYALNINANTNVFVIAVRVYYTLQVSPAPAVASFGDVPTSHPFFQFIEALKASGITGGCQAAPPLFCPDAPLTRGQMATFLAIALGLHFAP